MPRSKASNHRRVVGGLMLGESNRSGSPTAAGAVAPGSSRVRLASALARLDWLVYPILVAVLSRLVVFAAGVVGDVFLPTEPGHWVADPGSPFLSMWAKWDSQWYVQIVRDGYWYQPLQQSNVAFFPLYPMAVKVASSLLAGNAILAGFVVSNLAFVGALVLLYLLTDLELGEHGAGRRAVGYLAFFPTAFFLSCVYTESLFLLLSVACVYFARRRWWAAAAGAGLLASATRNLGVVLWMLTAWEWLRCQGWRLRQVHQRVMWSETWSGVRAHWSELTLISAIPLGLLAYVAFLKLNFDRPMAFIEVQAAWGRQNVGPVAVIARETRALLSTGLTKGDLSRVLNMGLLFGVLALVPFIWRRLGGGYALYVLILLLVPVSSSAMSLLRYALTLFPVFILLAGWGRRATVDRMVLASFAVGLGALTVIFVNWVFIA
jgi:Mannosyltransferase (PIG-V)